MNEVLTSQLHEKCAVDAVSSSNGEVDATTMSFIALGSMQHRGDAASGITSMTYDGQFDGHSGPGLVKDVYTPEILNRLAGSSAIGHNRYPTHGELAHYQPIFDKPMLFALAHNGNLSDTNELELFLRKSRIDTTHLNDSEMMAYAIAQSMRTGKDLSDSIKEIYPMLNGAFSCVASHGDTIAAFRDPLGIRPLNIAEIDGGYMIASETCAFRPNRGKHIGEVAAGELIILQKGEMDSVELAKSNPRFDIFEIVYFSRKNSTQFGESIGTMRRRLGQELAAQFPLKGDYLVTPVPESATPMAEGYAHALGLEYESIIERDRYRGGRSFMQATQAARHKYLDIKLDIIPGSATGRDVIVIDDSIVRNNTAPKVNQLCMEDGAKSVTFLVGSPPIGYPDYSGIDTPKQSKLIASENTPEEIRQQIGCKALGYLSLSRMIAATGQPASAFNLASFTGEYPYEIGSHANDITDSVSLEYLENAWAST